MNGGTGAIVYPQDGQIDALVFDGSWHEVTDLAAGVDSPSGVEAVPTGTGVSAVYADGENARVAFTASGTGLAVWDQFDRGLRKIDAAYFDGSSWGTPFVIDSDAQAPRVATNGTTFAIAYRKLGSPIRFWTGIYTPGTGMGTLTELTFGLSLSNNPELASDGTGYLALWEYRAPSAGCCDIYYNEAPDGVTWSAPTQLEAWNGTAGFQVPQLVGNSAGYLASYVSTANSSVALLRIYGGGSFAPSSSTYAGSSCVLAAGTSTFGYSCLSSNTVYTSIYSGGGWLSPAYSLATGGSSPLGLASDGTSYRMIDSNYSQVYSTTAASPWEEILGMSATAMASDGTEYVAIGMPYVNSYPSLHLYRSVSGTMTDVGLIEGTDSYAENPSLAFGGSAGYWAVWGQDDPASLTRVIYGKNL